MARKSLEILSAGTDVSSFEKYITVRNNLDSNSQRYELVERLEGNEGYLSVYRDTRTTACITVRGEGFGRDAFVTIVGDDEPAREAMALSQTVRPFVLSLKECSEEVTR